MSIDARDSVIRVAELIDRPGASRQVSLAVGPPPDLAPDLVAFAGPVNLDGVVESVVDGLLVRATVAADLTLACARCLTELQQPVSVGVVELFNAPETADDPEDIEEGYEISDGEIDVDTLLRDALIPAVPYRALCHQDCRGLCAQCGTNLNEQQCECVDERTDERWAALKGLNLGDGNAR